MSDWTIPNEIVSNNAAANAIRADYYREILDEIMHCKNESKSLPDHLSELDNLFEQLPEASAYCDAMKRTTLQSSIHLDFENMATASSLQRGITYSVMASHLLGDNHRLSSKRKAEAKSLTEASKHKLASTEETNAAANFANLTSGLQQTLSCQYQHYRKKPPK